MKLMTVVAAIAMSLALAAPARAQDDRIESALARELEEMRKAAFALVAAEFVPSKYEETEPRWQLPDPNLASAPQDENEALKKKILDEIAKKLDEEMKRILDDISRLIDDEIAKARGGKKAPAPPPAAGGKPGFLGVVVDSEQPDADDFKAWKVDGGVRITIVEGGAAEKAGLQDGDVIIEADGQKIREFPELQEVIRSRQAGETVKLKFLRGKETKEVSATLVGRPGAAPPAGGGPGPGPAPEAPKGRIGIRPGEPTGKGMEIEEVSPNAPAQKAGIKAGDILVKLDETPIWKVSDLENFMNRTKAGQKVEVTILRDGEEKKFTVELIAK